MSEWSRATLGEVLALEYGKALPERVRDGKGSPVLGSNGVVGYHSAHLVSGPGIVVGRKGTAGSVQWVESDFFPIDTTYFVRLRDTTATNMGFAALMLVTADLPRICAQTGVPGLNRDRAYELPILLPLLPEQRRIVDVMSAMDAAIEALEEEAASALSVYVSSAGLLWLDDAENPARLRPLGLVMELNVNREPIEADGHYRIAGLLNAGKGIIDKGTISGEGTAYTTLNRLAAKQAVMRKLTAWEGPIAVVGAEHDGFYASAEFPTFDLLDDLLPAYFSHVCRTERLWTEMRNRVTGTVQRRKRLSPQQLLSIELPIPGVERQRVIAAALDSLYSISAKMDEEAKQLRAFRSSLLTALLAQAITIPEAYDAVLGVAS